MAVVLGTNCGFVAVAPTENPAGTATGFDFTARAVKDTAPAGATKITQIGWWCNNATQAANFEVGLYSHDAGNDEPLNRLYVDNTNAKGTDGGWKTVVVDWDITPGTVYWIGVQLDNTATTTQTDYTVAGGRQSFKNYQTSLTNPWGVGSENTEVYSFYAVVESGGGGSIFVPHYYQKLLSG